MASPNFDLLHLQLARGLEDPVASASTDSDITSAVRSDYLNRAINEFVQTAYRICGRERVRLLLQEMVDTQTINPISSSGTAVETAYRSLPLEFVKTGSTAKYVLWHSKAQLDLGRNPHVDYAYVIDAGLIYVYENLAVINAGIGTLSHLGYRTDLVAADAGGAGDTTLPRKYWDAVVELAISMYYLDLNMPDKAIRERYDALLGMMVKGAA